MKGVAILVVEDDPKLAELLRQELKHEGYSVVAVSTGSEALLAVHEDRFDLIILDLNLPDIDGIDVAHRVREAIETPILMLTARADVDSRVKGLYAGASDYLAKPFSLQELLARVHARVRERSAEKVVEVGGLVVDLAAGSCRVGEHTVALTAREFELLSLFVDNRGRIFSRDELERRLYGGAMPGSNTVEVFISKLRNKLRSAGAGTVIETVRGAGYVVA